MLNVNNELVENINTDNFLPIDNEILEISTLIESYGLENDSRIINTIESQYSVVTKFIVGLYLGNQFLPDDLINFIKNTYNYKIFLLSNIQKRMKDIIDENSTHLFKEVYIILNLLSNGNKYEFLTKENMFSLEGIKNLLNNYEDNVCEHFIKNDKQNFELFFKYYLTVLEVLNQICVINSLDIERRKNMNGILELIMNTIINTKSKIQLIKSDIKSLNSILGKLLLYFTNITYIAVDFNNKELVIQKYASMLNKINEGYNLLEQDERFYQSFLDKTTSLILTLIYKLKSKLNMQNIELDSLKDLKEIYNLYNKNVKESQIIECTTIDEFREELLKNYTYLYDDDPLEYFNNLEIISNIDMQTIHSIILFSGHIEKNKLDLLLKSLLEKNKFDNDYYEFYKLKIIDRILQRYISLSVTIKENSLINEIIEYIEKNNLVSHLMSMYAKIYLSLSLYYSYEKVIESQKKSKNFYFIYQRLDNGNFLEKEFNIINKQILCNYGNNFFSQFNFRTEKSFLNIESIQIGKELTTKYIKQKDLEIRNESFFSIEKLLKEILEINEPKDLWLNKKIENLISNTIFFGLVKAKVENSSNNFNILEIGYDNYKIKIQDDYTLVLYYSSYYKTTFERILEKNIDFLELNIKNIFKSYINSIPSFTDLITKLPNINKLKNKLKNLKKSRIIFFEVYLDSLVTFSKSYNIKHSNNFFKAITNKINKNCETYRLFGPKIGIILEEDKDYKELISLLQKLEIDFENEKFPIKLTIAVSIGEANKILDKSFYTLSSARLSKNKLHVFE